MQSMTGKLIITSCPIPGTCTCTGSGWSVIVDGVADDSYRPTLTLSGPELVGGFPNPCTGVGKFELYRGANVIFEDFAGNFTLTRGPHEAFGNYVNGDPVICTLICVVTSTTEAGTYTLTADTPARDEFNRVSYDFTLTASAGLISTVGGDPVALPSIIRRRGRP